MSEAETAFAHAQEEIAEAASTGTRSLSFVGKNFGALNRLPPEIADLSDLQSLDLYSTQIADLSSLAGLTGLQTLHLERTQIVDLGPLASLSGLQNLYLEGTQITDLSPLASLANLHSLFLEDIQIIDILSLAGLTNLRNLSLYGSQIKDLAPLASLTGLKAIILDETQIINLTPLAGLTSLQILSVEGTQITDLTPLKDLTGLRVVKLTGTQITDLAPLTDLAGLHTLTLDHTQINDLRPIARLDKLGHGGGGAALSFKDTAATKSDARLARLAQIEDDRERSRETLTYLRTLPPWPKLYVPAATADGSPTRPIGRVANAPEQDSALPLIWGDNGFDFFAKSIDTDPVTDAALSDLRALLEGLRRKGNQHDDLYRIAGELQERSEGTINDLNMVKLHLSYQKLRRLHQGRAARQTKFDDETVSSMEAVFDVLPGVTLADDGVKVLIERQEAERAILLSAAQDEAAVKVLLDVQDPAAPFAPEVKNIAAEVLRQGVNDRLTGTRRILSRNVVVSALKWVVGASAVGAVGGPVGNFVYDNGRDLIAYAATMGDDALFWAQSVFTKFRIEYELTMGIAQEIASANAPRKPPAPRQDESSKD